MANGSKPSCPVCGAEKSRLCARVRDLEYRTSEETFSYWRCDACEVVYLAQPPVERLREIYPPNYYSYRVESLRRSPLVGVKEWLDRREFRRILATLPGERLNVLDVGGGSGWLLSVIRASCPRVDETHEVDLDESAGEAARQAGHFFHATCIERFHSPTLFDLIIMLNLIEHVASPRAVLEAMRGLLKPGGSVMIKTPNYDTLDRRLFGDRWGGWHCPRHWVLFTRDSLIRLAESCGLRCVEARYTQGGSQWACGALGWLSDHGWARVTPERPMYQHPLFQPIAAAGAAFDLARMPVAKTAQMLITLRRDDEP